MFASICLRVLSRIQRGGARLVTDFTPKPLAPVTAADRHALGSLLTGIGFAALGIGENGGGGGGGGGDEGLDGELPRRRGPDDCGAVVLPVRGRGRGGCGGRGRDYGEGDGVLIRERAG